MAKTAAKPRKKKQELTYPVPTSLIQVAQYEREIGTLLDEISSRRQRLAAQIQSLEEKAETEASVFSAKALALAKALYAYVDENRQTLTENDTRKTVSIPGAGVVRWYSTPPAVELDEDIDEQELIERLETLKLNHFVTVKKSLNKEAISAEPEEVWRIKGLTLTSREKFAIKPVGRNDRMERFTDLNRWKIVSEKSEPLPD